MTRILPLVFVFIIAHFHSKSQSCTIVQQQVGLSIPDNNDAGTNALIPLELNGQLGINWVLDSVRLQVTHTYLGDLSAVIINPAGDTAVLFDRPGVPNSTYGCGNDNVNAVFGDMFTLLAEGVCYPDPLSLYGTIKPITPLQILHNATATQGTWKINVSDRAGGDIGAIDNVWLYFTPVFYADGDSDGFGAGTGTKQCNQPPGAVFNNSDCNDQNPSIHPGAAEICANKVDEDCTGFDTDYLYQPELTSWNTNGFCRGDSALLLLAPYQLGDTVFWFFNNIPLPSNTGNFFYADTAGTYSAAILQTNGCYYQPGEITVEEYPAPSPQITLTSGGLFAGNYTSYTWSLNGFVLPEANDAYLNPPSNGIYWVNVTDENGCTGTSANFIVDIAGIGSSDIPELFFCYPNPAQEFIFVDFQIEPSDILSILDVTGKNMAHFPAINSILKLDVSQLKAGMYFLNYQSTRIPFIKN
jgi:subtilisin-like proprotein convertase family protein